MAYLGGSISFKMVLGVIVLQIGIGRGGFKFDAVNYCIYAVRII